MVQPIQPSQQNTTLLAKQIRRLQHFQLPLITSLVILSLPVVQNGLAYTGRESGAPSSRLAPETQGAAVHEAAVAITESDDSVDAEIPAETTALPTEPIVDDRPVAGFDETHFPQAEWNWFEGLSLEVDLPEELFAEIVSQDTTDAVSVEQPLAGKPPEEPPSASVAEPERIELAPEHTTLRNPSESGGEIHFLVAGEIDSLRVGESREYRSETPLQVQFHRGDDFGNAEFTLGKGTFEFRVTEQGWDLQEVEPTGDWVRED